MAIPDWRRLVDHVMSIPERVYEHWNASDGWDNDTQFGRQYGENRVSWCVIFDWDMYADCGLQGIVPRVDNVTAFSDWARAHHQWSEYPSVGAWVNLGSGAHTELVVGFDADTVYTKGGNSLQAGAVDNGQGNGVWQHAIPRRSPRVVGYFAPRFPDGQCPPTADLDDPRGGAVKSWRWTSAAPISTTLHQEDDMPTPLDVWAYKNATQAKADPKMPDAYGYLVGTNTAVKALTAQLGALTAAVAALARDGGLPLAQVQAAAEAGAKAALAELGDALTKED